MFFNNVINLSIFAIASQVLYYGSCATAGVRDYGADIGSNITLPCLGISKLTNTENIMWVFDGKTNKVIRNTVNQDDGSLNLNFINTNDSGLYTCMEEFENQTGSKVIGKTNLTVRTVPMPLVNVTVHLSTILGLIFWDVEDDGGYPVRDFTAEYRAADPPPNQTELEPWRPITPNHIPPNSRQIDVYHLIPNASYWFRVWANNPLGSSVPVEALGRTLISDVDTELRQHLLNGYETFDKRIWVVAVAIVMGTLCVLTAGTCLLLYRECRAPADGDEQDVMELVPNIILNPGFAPDGGPAEAPAVAVCGGKYSRTNGSAEPRKV